ncbi:adhesion G protein-coupled receptor E3-like [Hoplias malabaricus]|uniref:adhesion G protein-coupled receptor E3-like n=1 Tax=Hoplias malabaricus TaxID=27720 RepID=UPI0034622FEA
MAFSSLLSYDPCNNYTSLDLSWTDTIVTGKWNCNNQFGNGWYRLRYYGMNLRMAETSVNESRCGTNITLWLNGLHPQIADGIVTRVVCGAYESISCSFRSTPIQVKACPGSYYVYEFVSSAIFYAAYCAGVNTTNSATTPSAAVSPMSFGELFTSLTTLLTVCGGKIHLRPLPGLFVTVPDVLNFLMIALSVDKGICRASILGRLFTLDNFNMAVLSTVECVVICLTEIQNNTGLVIPKETIISTLDTVLNNFTKILEYDTSNQSQLLYYGNSILNATETLVSALLRQTDTDYWDNIDLPSLGINSVDIISYSNMSDFLKPSFFTTTNSTGNIMISTIVSVKLLSTNNQIWPKQGSRTTSIWAFNVLLKVLNFNGILKVVNKRHGLKETMPPEQGSTLYCVTWKGTKWEDGFCKATSTSSNYTTCSCVHPGTFALIMQTSDSLEYKPWLDLINTIAVSLGLVFLSLALLTFVFCRRDMTMINTALINLCLSLLLAQLLYLLTEKVLLEILSKTWCAAMAGVLHFLFLSAFVWMFIEAVLLFIYVKNLTKIRSKQNEVLNWKYLMLIGYIIPLFVVGVSAGIFPDGYGSDECWLKTDDGFFWSFLGPVCFILGSNFILFIITCILMYATLKKLNSGNLQVQQKSGDNSLVKSVMLKTLLQFVIIGCSWILGFFTESSDAVNILFLVLNSQQGTFIFFIHCVLNQKIREHYKTFLCDLCCSGKNAPEMPRKKMENRPR